MVVRKDYSSPNDLRRMQNLVQHIWSHSCGWHIGDLAWQRSAYKEGNPDWPTSLWQTGDEVLAWGWIHLPDTLDWAVHPKHGELSGEVLNWFEEVASSETLQVTVLEHETHLMGALLEHGYHVLPNAPFSNFVAHTLDSLPKPTLPDGFVARAVRDEEDVAQRALVHQKAWRLLPFSEGELSVNSSMTVDRYRKLIGTWPYRPELDWIIEAPSGDFAACCCLWFDEVNGVGELEPLGTAPEYRRMGLGSAVCLAAMNAVHEAGASEVIVHPRGDNKYPYPNALYKHLGFTPYGRTYTYVKNRKRR